MQVNRRNLSKLTLAMGLLACHGQLFAAGQNSIVIDVADQSKKLTVKSAPVTHYKSKKDDDDITHATIPVDNNNDTALLGIGYDAQADALKALNTVYVAQQSNGTLLGDNDGNGIDDGATLMGNTKASFTVAVDQSFEDSLSLIEGSASVAINLPAITANGNVDLALSTAASSTSSSYTLFARVEPKKSVWLPAESASNQAGSGTDLQATTALTDWVNVVGTGQPLIDRIGDEFVQATEYGAWLMVNIKFDYHNSQDKFDIGGRLKVDYSGLVEVEGGVDWSSLENAETVKVTFTAQQAGGVPSELVNVVPVNLLSCTLSAPQVCLGAFADAVSYMKGNFVNQFASNADYNATRYYTRRYDESGPTLTTYMAAVQPQQRTFGSELALRQMSSHWMQAKQDEKRADYLLVSQGSYLNSTQQTAIAAVKTAAGQNITLLTNTMNACRVSTPDACDNDWTGPAMLQSYNNSVLEIQ
jgi:hypothetical protein